MKLKPIPPTLLLIGVGHFGRVHLEEWQKLEQEGRVRIKGLVVASEKSRRALARQTGLPVHRDFSPAVLAGVDAVDISTPTASHADLVAACLPQAHVFVEKPLCEDPRRAKAMYDLADRHGRVLMAGHIYHHQPLTELLRQTLRSRDEAPAQLQLTFTNPADEYRPGLDPFLEWSHAFDLVREVTSVPVISCRAWRQGVLAEASIATRDGMRGVLRLGWQGLERARRVQLAYPDLRIGCDYLDGSFVETRRDGVAKRFLGHRPSALRSELVTFLSAIAGRGEITPKREQVLEVLSLMDRARRSVGVETVGRAKSPSTRPRVAILGGGVFGATCALELSRTCDVTLYERHSALLTEASYLNQWRHHSGFHYPRSIETIQEVQAAKGDFESVFEPVILRDIDAYFAVSAFGKEITPERYLATCKANGLKFRVVRPPANIVYPDRVSVCLHTDEAVVEIDRLTRLLMRKLKGSRHVELRLGSEVRGARLLADGRKRLAVRGAGGEAAEEFDFLVNATYANSNRIGHWLGFPLRPLRFDLLELAVYRIPNAPRFMMTVLDAPFTSLTSLGSDDLFMLSHIHQSVLASQVTKDGLPPRWGKLGSNRDNLLRHGLRYLPILKEASYVESRVGVRTVEAYSEDFDGRPTVVTPHGFGCWSVLGGKIITAVSNARELASAIAQESGNR